MFGHPAILKVVRGGFVRENVHEEFPAWFQGVSHFGHEKLVVLHVFEEFDGDDAVIGVRREFVIDDVARDDFYIGQTFGFGDRVDVQFLRARVGEAGDFAVGEFLG